MTDPAATLHALADWFRNVGPYADTYPPDEADIAFADLFDGIAKRHKPDWYPEDQIRTLPPLPSPGCNGCFRPWPCPDVKAALAVAAAHDGIEPPPKDSP